ncbi:anthranilate synthase component I family protein [Adhaeribacter sp. BT258]|uniref:Anthranilate synthase component I family protein n=1 Tax=Adhaeribacter terrigena TaxID=2793070 RepID=A0ABS1C0M0_9BACT|nr:anthranilate synthase component I family protein [Adhaeribacter terrigena]MBK0402955.1 anthranilate synthase component I family protein [Adhaeribacter terrigena]
MLEFLFSDLNINAEDFRRKALHWAEKFAQLAYFDGNNIPYLYNGFENLLAISDAKTVGFSGEKVFAALERISTSGKFWCGLLSYDLKNQVENLKSQHEDFIGFPEAHFFEPEIQLTFSEKTVGISASKVATEEILHQILTTAIPETQPHEISWQSRTSEEKYLENVRHIQDHILEGDVYELNYTIEFFAENATVFPVQLFEALNKKSPTPFAGFFRLNDSVLMCASPERFLKKAGNKLISQPIKGTIKRGRNPKEDAFLKDQLLNDEKERAENLMIVDLVRNDLSRSAETGSVNVEELFGIYGFQQVFQMISTVTAQARPEENLASILKHTFPMGSMTGAPKIRAMQRIEQYEDHRRGLYSGSIGYLQPNGDFDFNVVIRSLQYNAKTKYLSYKVGSAITIDSVPEKEFQECLLKAKAIMEVC